MIFCQYFYIQTKVNKIENCLFTNTFDIATIKTIELRYNCLSQMRKKYD